MAHYTVDWYNGNRNGCVRQRGDATSFGPSAREGIPGRIQGNTKKQEITPGAAAFRVRNLEKERDLHPCLQDRLAMRSFWLNENTLDNVGNDLINVLSRRPTASLVGPPSALNALQCRAFLRALLEVPTTLRWVGLFSFLSSTRPYPGRASVSATSSRRLGSSDI